MPESGPLFCNLDENKRKVAIVLSQLLNIEAMVVQVNAPYDAKDLLRILETIIKTTKEVFVCDPLYTVALEGLRLPDCSALGGVLEQQGPHRVAIAAMLLDMSLLKGSILAFMESHLTPEEKEVIGFNSGS